MQGLQGFRTALDVIVRCAGEVYALNGPCYYYNLECRAVAGTQESNWDLGPKLVHGDTFLRTGWSELRLPNVVARRVSDASWRFGYLMTLDEMRTKLCLNSDIAVRHACASFSTLNRLAIAAATCANPFGRKDVPLAVYTFLYEELPTHATYRPNRERFLRPGEPAGPKSCAVPDVESMPHWLARRWAFPPTRVAHLCRTFAYRRRHVYAISDAGRNAREGGWNARGGGEGGWNARNGPSEGSFRVVRGCGIRRAALQLHYPRAMPAER